MSQPGNVDVGGGEAPEAAPGKKNCDDIFDKIIKAYNEIIKRAKELKEDKLDLGLQ